MLAEFLRYFRSLDPRGTCLLAVSGGVDSVVMAHLFAQADLPFGIAHCNFRLRAAASDADAAHVENLAKELGVDFFGTAFDTRQVAEQRKQSIQVAARELRYDWLHELAQREGYAHIATAHHLNDSIETMLLNLARGCGISGLHGIPATNGRVLRPLLFATKDQILAFAKDKQLAFREDASNDSDKYARNYLRHHALPALRHVNPSLEHTMDENIARFKDVEYIYEIFIQNIKEKYISKDGAGLVSIDLAPIMEHAPAATSLLYEMLRPYGFNNDQTKQLWASIGAGQQSGKQFFSPTHRLLLDRGRLLLSEHRGKADEMVSIHAHDALVAFGGHQLRITYEQPRTSDFLRANNLAYLDADKLEFPLHLRIWADGDHMQPLGMNGRRQKVKKILTDKKLSVFEKQDTWVLLSNEAICWLVGHRVDDRFKITPSTKRTARFELTGN
jgi:tRNA(Ile)-lysidine synthase